MIESGYSRHTERTHLHLENRTISPTTHFSTRSRSLSASHRHQGKRHRHHTFMMGIVCCLFLLTIMTCIVMPGLKGTDNTPKLKCYASVQIEKGDNLWTLCDPYYTYDYKDKQEYILEVKRLNHLSDAQNITAGAYLILPYYITQ